MTLLSPYALTRTLPTPEVYCRLRVTAGLSEKSIEAAERGLPNSLFAASILHAGAIVAMGRVIGDNGLFFEIVDIAVHPDHQRRGLGKAIVAALMDQIYGTAPSTAHVTLIADGDARHLYAKFGFHPVEPDSIGMAQKLP